MFFFTFPNFGKLMLENWKNEAVNIYDQMSSQRHFDQMNSPPHLWIEKIITFGNPTKSDASGGRFQSSSNEYLSGLLTTREHPD